MLLNICMYIQTSTFKKVTFNKTGWMVTELTIHAKPQGLSCQLLNWFDLAFVKENSPGT